MGSVKQMLIEEMLASPAACGCGVTDTHDVPCVRCGEPVPRCSTCDERSTICDYCANIDDGD